MFDVHIQCVIGKVRLCAHKLAKIWIVPVASVLGICSDPPRSLAVSLIEDLHEKNLLILLNHYEHLLGACAQLADTLLSTCTDVYILAISQQPLNLALEARYLPANPLHLDNQ